MERSDSTRIPDRVGLALFGTLGKLVAVRAPHDLDPIFRKAGGSWEPWSKRWLIERHRIGPVIRFSARPLTHCSDRPVWTSTEEGERTYSDRFCQGSRQIRRNEQFRRHIRPVAQSDSATLRPMHARKCQYLLRWRQT
jgi:hypothetical protein